jgi:hypothetical protein
MDAATDTTTPNNFLWMKITILIVSTGIDITVVSIFLRLLSSIRVISLQNKQASVKHRLKLDALSVYLNMN